MGILHSRARPTIASLLVFLLKNINFKLIMNMIFYVGILPLYNDMLTKFKFKLENNIIMYNIYEGLL